MLRDFYLGFMKIHVLHHAAQRPVYGLALIDELRRHGYQLGPGTLYPLLHSLETAGYIAREDRLVGGKIRKYYTATAAGRAALADAQSKIRELVDEVLEGQGPAALLDEVPDGVTSDVPGDAEEQRGKTTEARHEE